MSVGADLRAAVRAALIADPEIAATVNGYYDLRPADAGMPFVIVGDALITDWSGKGFAGREVRLALSIHGAARAETDLAALAGTVERVIAAMPAALPAATVITTELIRQRGVRDGSTGWTVALDYRFRIALN